MKKTTLILAAALLCVCLLTGCGYSLEGGQPDGEVVSSAGIALGQAIRRRCSAGRRTALKSSCSAPK